jgi:putative hydrolase of the HAD superfamily
VSAPLKAIIFDLGGTLLHLSYPFFKEQFQQRQLPLEEEIFFAAVANANRQISLLVEEKRLVSTDASRLPLFFRNLLNELRFEANPDAFVEFVLSEHHRRNLWHYLLPNTAELLQTLQRDFRLAMISNADGRAEALTIEFGIRPYLEFVIDSHFVGVEKPNPKIFELALERLGLAANECAYVGDIYGIDVLGAKAAAISAILVDRTLPRYDDCTVIRSIFELPATLRNPSTRLGS